MVLALAAVAALAFSLEGDARRLSVGLEPCATGCDDGNDASCDEQDEGGAWTRSCDMHPTTSCDEDCHYPPPPPKAPWMGEQGTYPSPPPSPPPPNHEVVVYSSVGLVVAILFFCCVCFSANYGTGTGTSSERAAYWCCACLLGRRNDNSWYYDDDRETRAVAAASQGAGTPGIPNAADEPSESEGVLRVETRLAPNLALPTLALIK
tara:strand:+ start:481 stop:1101 length:621 start_codon:yes stop_codon:yes gene_type:complete